MVTYFNRSELAALYFDLNIYFDDLPGETRTDKARELIEFMTRQERLPQLLTLLQKERPFADWPAIPDELPSPITADDPDTKIPSGSTLTLVGQFRLQNLNIGGIQEITGDIQADMRETTIQQPQVPFILVITSRCLVISATQRSTSKPT